MSLSESKKKCCDLIRFEDGSLENRLVFKCSCFVVVVVVFVVFVLVVVVVVVV